MPTLHGDHPRWRPLRRRTKAVRQRYSTAVECRLVLQKRQNTEATSCFRRTRLIEHCRCTSRRTAQRQLHVRTASQASGHCKTKMPGTDKIKKLSEQVLVQASILEQAHARLCDGFGLGSRRRRRQPRRNLLLLGQAKVPSLVKGQNK